MVLKSVPNLPEDRYDARWLARLMQRSHPGQNGCIEVDGWHNEDGYAAVGHRKWGDFAHRIIMILIHGPIPEGFMVCHRCGNHGCVNPDHLYIGTMKDNARDTVAMGRHLEANKTECVHGHPFTPDNTRVTKEGKRQCVECQRERQRERWRSYTPEQRARIYEQRNARRRRPSGEVRP